MPQPISRRNQWPTSSDYRWYTLGGYTWPTPGDYGWYTPVGDAWLTPGDYGWYTPGGYVWHTPGDHGWPIIARSMTLTCHPVLTPMSASM